MYTVKFLQVFVVTQLFKSRSKANEYPVQLDAVQRLNKYPPKSGSYFEQMSNKQRFAKRCAARVRGVLREKSPGRWLAEWIWP